MRTRLCLLLLVPFLLLKPIVARAQWVLDGLALSTATGAQQYPTIAPDGFGGAFVTWYDGRNGNYDIFIQHVNAQGDPLWTTDGVAVCTAVQDQYSPQPVADGSGGVIVTWVDHRSGVYAPYAQRMNAAGVAQWTPDGVELSPTSSDPCYPQIVSDGAGGAIMLWEDNRTDASDIYVQRLNAAGTALWTPNGVALCSATGIQPNARIVADGFGGAIAAWQDYRSGTPDVYAQRINASGVVQWIANGSPVCTESHFQTLPYIASNGSGGAFIAWTDYRNNNSDIYAQMVSALGVSQWTANGLALCTDPASQNASAIAADGAGGAFVVWSDSRSGTYLIYAQRVDAVGPQWAANGVAISTASGNEYNPVVAADGSGGAVIVWHDFRNGADYDVYAQRVDASGAAQWKVNGTPVSTAGGDQTSPVIISDAAGGAIVTWMDHRGADYDIYAQRIEGVHGYWYPRPELVAVADVPVDQGGRVKVNWTASNEDVPYLNAITHYAVWRATDAAAASQAAAQGFLVQGPSQVPGDFDGRAVWTQHTAAADYYWEWLANVDAHFFSAYSYTATTRSDSTSQGSSDESYLVSAQTSDPFLFFDSNVMTGHSVDNLAPAAPMYLTANRAGSDVNLKWNRVRVSDLKNYSVFRGTSTGVTPIPVNFLADDTDTVLVDPNAPTSALYYIVTANDVHGNQSAPSNEAAVSGNTGAGNLPPVTALTVLQNHPNPFGGETQLEVGLPARSDLRIEIYDVAGRRVRNVLVPAREQGWGTLRISARDNEGRLLPSGVYFYRVHAGADVVTRKMVIAR